MKTHYIACLTSEELSEKKESIIAKQTQIYGGQVKYGDDFVRTPDASFLLEIVRFDFPLSNFFDHESVDCSELLKKIEKVVVSLKELAKKEPENKVTTKPKEVIVEENKGSNGGESDEVEGGDKTKAVPPPFKPSK